MKEKEEKKVFINSDNTIVFECSSCKKIKIFDIFKEEKLQSVPKVKIKCKSCNTITHYKIEKRKFFRKETNFSGKYWLEEKKIKGLMTVIDISKKGIKFILKDWNNLEVGDNLEVEFNLDDANKTKIIKDVVIRSKNNKEYGGEFASIFTGDAYDKAIGFYLMTAKSNKK